MVRILASGDTALVVEFGDTAERRMAELVLALDARIAAAAPAGLVETVPTLRSLMIHYDPSATSHRALREVIAPLLNHLEGNGTTGRRHEIPVCYEGELAPDLEEVARATRIDPARVVALHAGVTYRVYCLGFLPGCPYMGDIASELQLPRRTTPRTNVPRGAVAIATTMTNIYPLESPGGWHLIGRTPVSLFDLSKVQPVLLAPADEVRFVPIGRAEYDRLATAGGMA